MTELQLRQSAVKVMQGWLGGRQGSAIHRDIVDTYNSYLPHPRGHALTMTDAWCAGTVSAAAIRAGLTDIMPVECSCSRLIQLYKGLGRWVEDDSHVPEPGDLIIYDWEDTGKGDNVGQPDHVGMVETVSGSTMKIIEGNYNSMVQRRTLKVNGRYIRGFCCPDYKSKAAALTPKPAPVPTPTGGDDMDPAKFNQMFTVAMQAYRNTLRDNDSSDWSEKARKWVIEKGIFEGGGNGSDGKPNYMWEDLLTREQAALILYRTAVVLGLA